MYHLQIPQREQVVAHITRITPHITQNQEGIGLLSDTLCLKWISNQLLSVDVVLKCYRISSHR